MLNVWTAVKVINPELQRHGQAGTVQQRDDSLPDWSGVKFDVDGEVEFVKDTDLQVL